MKLFLFMCLYISWRSSFRQKKEVSHSSKTSVLFPHFMLVKLYCKVLNQKPHPQCLQLCPSGMCCKISPLRPGTHGCWTNHHHHHHHQGGKRLSEPSTPSFQGNSPILLQFYSLQRAELFKAGKFIILHCFPDSGFINVYFWNSNFISSVSLKDLSFFAY